jgi:hypothetical protein
LQKSNIREGRIAGSVVLTPRTMLDAAVALTNAAAAWVVAVDAPVDAVDALPDAAAACAVAVAAFDAEFAKPAAIAAE